MAKFFIMSVYNAQRTIVPYQENRLLEGKFLNTSFDNACAEGDYSSHFNSPTE